LRKRVRWQGKTCRGKRGKAQDIVYGFGGKCDFEIKDVFHFWVWNIFVNGLCALHRLTRKSVNTN
jgi:hypothetical protein